MVEIIRVIQVQVQREDSYNAMGLKSYEDRLNKLKPFMSNADLNVYTIPAPERGVSAEMVVQMKIETVASMVSAIDEVLDWKYRDKRFVVDKNFLNDGD
jgi:hypothetical protein